MTPLEYRTALTTLGLTQQAAGRWLRVCPKTAQNYAKFGPSGPAAVAVEMRLALRELQRYESAVSIRGKCGTVNASDGEYVRYDDIAQIAALKGAAG